MDENNGLQIKFNIFKLARIQLYVSLPTLIVLGVIFYLFAADKGHFYSNIVNQISLLNIIIFSILTFIGFVVHELLHAFAFLLFSRSLQTIKIGIHPTLYMPYCHCSQKLKIWKFIIVAVLPTIVLGLLPFVWSVRSTNIWFFLYSYIFILGGIADIAVCLKLFKYPLKYYVLDNPNDLSLTIFKSL